MDLDAIAIVDGEEESSTVDADDRLSAWWSQLTESQRFEAYGIGTHTPMPGWMAKSLVEAGITGLVDAPSKPPGLDRPWCYMPAAVAKVVARKRRGDN
jgi:hypothetical protein